MRHQKQGKKLSRKKAHRNHLMRNLITQTFLHSRIKTTLAKAKVVKPQLEKTLTRAFGKDEVNVKRFLKSYLYSDKAVENVLTLYKKDLEGLDGGYSRIIKLGKRKGDGSQMAIIDLRVGDENRPEKIKGSEETDSKEDAKSETKEKEEEDKGSFWDRFKSDDSKPDKKIDQKTKPKGGKDPTQRTTNK